MKEGKVWGTTELITANPACELHRIDILEGGYCSKHQHRTKSNGFLVHDGRLLIREWHGDLIDETILTAGQYKAVAPGIRHQFEALAPTTCYELYWAEYSPDDIDRESVGGVRA